MLISTWSDGDELQQVKFLVKKSEAENSESVSEMKPWGEFAEVQLSVAVLQRCHFPPRESQL